MSGRKIRHFFRMGIHYAQSAPVFPEENLLVNMLALPRRRCYTLLLQPCESCVIYYVEDPGAGGWEVQYEKSRDDQRLSVEKYPAVQPAADADAGAGGAVQPQRCGHRRQIRLQHLCRPGRRRLHHHAGIPVHRPAYRHRCRRQRVCGPLAGHRRRRERGAHHPLLPADLSGRGHTGVRDLSVLCRADAAAVEHKGGVPPRRRAVPAHLRAGSAGHGHLQLRQRHPQRHRRYQAPADLSVCGRCAERHPESGVRHRLPYVRRGRGHRQRHRAVGVGHSHLCPPAAADGCLPSGRAEAAHPQNGGQTHPDDRHPLRPAERHLCRGQPVRAGGPELL